VNVFTAEALSTQSNPLRILCAPSGEIFIYSIISNNSGVRKMILQLLPALTLLFLPPTIWVVAIGMAVSGLGFFVIYRTVSQFGDTPNE
jgi:hypothetical protein